ncbi:hypothetical protein QBC43DRAFT_323666 [Cladorrhinum sp. PSN259]|nr:hypothetical protein QBC43DRAFT_323666 [Cladorrhinum sp. PSN259]
MGPRQPATLPSSSSSSFLPSQLPHRLVTATSSTGSLGSLPSQSQHSHASPGGSLASPTKSPFVRPAEIYKRLEEEKRRSLEVKRPNVTNLASDLDNAPGEPARYTLSDSESRASTSLGEVAETNKGLGVGLATVPERRGEYGLEGLLDSYGIEESKNEPSQGPPLSPSAGTNIQAPQPFQHPDESQAQAGVELRRFSSSPQLPLVARLSGFGEDLFSPDIVSDDSNKKQHPKAPTGGPKEQMSFTTHSPSTIQNAVLARAVNTESEPSKEFDVSSDLSKSNAGPTAIDSRSPLGQPEQAIGPQDGSTAAQPTNSWTTQQPAEDLGREPASSANINNKIPIRPSIPGGWVTETIVTPGEQLLPWQGAPVQAESLANDADAGSSGISGADRSRQPSPAIVSNSNESTSTQQASTPPPLISPPPLRNSSSATDNDLDMPKGQNPKERGASPRDTGNTLPFPPNSINVSLQNRDITPTAPLNPRRDAPEVSANVQSVLSPPSNGIEAILDAEASSPLKESDVLSEEIIKSLSPVQSSENFDNISGATPSAYQAAAEERAEEPGGESSYLGDVYDDYWAAGEERVDSSRPGSKQTEEHAESPLPAYSGGALTAGPISSVEKPATLTSPLPSTSNDTTPTLQTAASPEPGDNRRRFSWEAGFSDPDPMVNQLAAAPRLGEQKSISSEIGQGASVSSPTNTAALAIPNLDGSAPSLVSSSETKPDTPPASGGISHQVSQTSTLAARSTNAPIEPPSPISVASEHQKPPDLADTLIGASPSQISTDDQLTPKALVPRAPSPKYHVNITPFRSILEMGSSTERSTQFDEARFQFAAIDTGLEEWLATMVAMHPEHNNSSFGASREALQSLTGQFQQVGHLSPANIPMPPLQQHGTGFGHLHGSNQVNQVGTKSKELLMAAGKAGKGLFSKGRNKLRTTGDKVFS